MIEKKLDASLEAKQLRVYAEILRRWQADPTCDAIECVISGLEVQANRLEERR